MCILLYRYSLSDLANFCQHSCSLFRVNFTKIWDFSSSSTFFERIFIMKFARMFTKFREISYQALTLDSYLLYYGKIWYFRNIDMSIKNDISLIFYSSTSLGFLIFSPGTRCTSATTPPRSSTSRSRRRRTRPWGLRRSASTWRTPATAWSYAFSNSKLEWIFS